MVRYCNALTHLTIHIAHPLALPLSVCAPYLTTVILTRLIRDISSLLIAPSTRPSITLPLITYPHDGHSWNCGRPHRSLGPSYSCSGAHVYVLQPHALPPADFNHPYIDVQNSTEYSIKTLELSVPPSAALQL